VIPAETQWAVRALRRARDRLAASKEDRIPDEFWVLDPAAMFAATGEALMWIVMLDDWYSRDHPGDYERLKTGMGSVLLGLRWARNRTLHDFALLTGFVRRRWAEDTIHPGWQDRKLLPAGDPRFDRGAPQYDGRVAGRALVEPIDDVTKWFEGWVEIELKRQTGED
jgi:hypothetical protein